MWRKWWPFRHLSTGSAYLIVSVRYDLPNITDLQVVVVPCLKRDGNKLYAYFTLDRYPMNYPWLGSHRKFVNLERRVNGTSEDRVVEQHTCDITSRVNDHNSGGGGDESPPHAPVRPSSGTPAAPAA